MGSIASPIPLYVPLLPECCVTAKLLSAAQLETIVYAGQAHERTLVGYYLLNKDATALVPDAKGRAHRTGYFLGDGTGTGKGRQVAGIILDNWLKGRKRAIWIAENETLLEDARRDWSALGGIGLDIVALSSWSLGSAITLGEGILYVSYATLRSQRADASRLGQILDWAGPEFDGVIVFDEAYAMGGVAGGEGTFGTTKGSEQGLAGVALQHHLADARIVYASATGASDINNLAYAVRLGLWGPETAFVDRESFISAIRRGGFAAMELVAHAELDTDTLYIATGLLLPIWNKLPSDFMDVQRITTSEGLSILGRIVEERDVSALRVKLGLVASAELGPAAMISAVMVGQSVPLKGHDQLTLKRARVNRENRLELVGANPRRLEWYKAGNCGNLGLWRRRDTRSEADHCGIHLRDERRYIRDGDIIIADVGRNDIGGEYDGIVLSVSHCNIPVCAPYDWTQHYSAWVSHYVHFEKIQIVEQLTTRNI